MRVQLQEGFIHTYGIPLTASAQRGVTLRQVRDTMATLYNEAQGGNIPWFPYTNKVASNWLRSSIIKSSQKLNTYPPGGISGRRISFLSEQHIINGRDFRIDIDNLVGTNLKE